MCHSVSPLTPHFHHQVCKQHHSDWFNNTQQWNSIQRRVTLNTQYNDHNLALNITKTMEIVIDHRKAKKDWTCPTPHKWRCSWEGHILQVFGDANHRRAQLGHLHPHNSRKSQAASLLPEDIQEIRPIPENAGEILSQCSREHNKILYNITVYQLQPGQREATTANCKNITGHHLDPIIRSGLNLHLTLSQRPLPSE